MNNMENDRRSQLARFKALLVTGVVTVAALVAMIGVYQNINQEEPEKTQLVQEAPVEVAKEDSTNLAAGESSGVEYEGYEEYDGTQQTVDSVEPVMTEDASAAGTSNETADGATGENADSQAVFAEKTTSFGPGSTIAWPVKGNVLMDYSMDKTVYFATLDQYKYNPAVVIQADVNAKVIAGAEGTIEDIQTNENTGTTVTVDLGNGYQAVYGQLKEVKKKEGDKLAAEDVIGYIAEPTKYYSVEGSNLYFAMTKDEKPVNPMEFLK